VSLLDPHVGPNIPEVGAKKEKWHLELEWRRRPFHLQRT